VEEERLLDEFPLLYEDEPEEAPVFGLVMLPEERVVSDVLVPTTLLDEVTPSLVAVWLDAERRADVVVLPTLVAVPL
jgi:hypothetical protein